MWGAEVDGFDSDTVHSRMIDPMDELSKPYIDMHAGRWKMFQLGRVDQCLARPEFQKLTANAILYRFSRGATRNRHPRMSPVALFIQIIDHGDGACGRID